MTFDPVPWIVGGGAEHSANVARNVAYASFGGKEGVINPTALEVKPLSTPGTSVRIMPGTVAIKNKATGVIDEMYVGRLMSQETVAIAATGAGAGRSDLIVVRIEDPNEPGPVYPIPSNRAVGPYIFARVISNVPSTTTSASQLGLSRSEYALARIDIPASTGTITAAMIKDLRDLATPAKHVQRELVVLSPGSKQLLPANGTYKDWPAESLALLDVPEWATHVRAVAHVAGVAFGADGNNSGAGWTASGTLRFQFNFDGTFVYGQDTAWNIDVDGGIDRDTLMTATQAKAIPLASRGGTIRVRLEGKRTNSGTTAAEFYIDSKSMVALDFEFYVKAESSG